MNQATFLISRYLIEKYPELEDLKGNKLRERLHKLLQCPRLWEKMKTLSSEKYTKQYQAPGQMLERVDFYAYAEDWCFLSILSNSSGFSRCFIFIHLLRYDIGDLSLEDDGTTYIDKKIDKFNIIICNITLDKNLMIYRRKPRTTPSHPHLPEYPPVHLNEVKEKSFTHIIHK